VKNIINKKDRNIIKNNKSHYLYYAGYQEDIWHNKKQSLWFEDKIHHYYIKHHRSFYYFNGDWNGQKQCII
jgi:hypothetical protein